MSRPPKNCITPDLREWIEARAVPDDAGCWLWQLTVVHGKQPQGRYLGKIVKVRREIWEQTRGKAMPVNSFAVCRHGNAACVRPDHVVSISRSKAQIGKPMPPHQRAAIARACQGIRKLKAEDVQEIRASDEPRGVLAARKKISETYVQQIQAGQVWRDFSSPFAGLGARAANDTARRAAPGARA
jgi:hypothetical protein